jgi:hypothetical protein
MRFWLRRIDTICLGLAAIGLCAAGVSVLLANTLFRAPSGCEECDQYIVWSFLFPVMGIGAMLVFGIVGLALHKAARTVQASR